MHDDQEIKRMRVSGSEQVDFLTKSLQNISRQAVFHHEHHDPEEHFRHQRASILSVFTAGNSNRGTGGKNATIKEKDEDLIEVPKNMINMMMEPYEEELNIDQEFKI